MSRFLKILPPPLPHLFQFASDAIALYTFGVLLCVDCFLSIDIKATCTLKHGLHRLDTDGPDLHNCNYHGNLHIYMKYWLFLHCHIIIDNNIYLFLPFIRHIWINDSEIDVNIKMLPSMIYSGFKGSMHCRNVGNVISRQCGLPSYPDKSLKKTFCFKVATKKCLPTCPNSFRHISHIIC